MRNPDGSIVGFVTQTQDISQRKQAEADQQFLLDLSSTLTDVLDPSLIIESAVRQLGEYLKLARFVLSDSITDEGRVVVSAGYHPGLPSFVGSYPRGSFGNLDADLSANRVVIVSDAETDRRTALRYQTVFTKMGTRALLCVPFYRDHAWLGTLSLSHREAHFWSDREIYLAQSVLNRLWPAVENARLLQAIQEREQQRDIALDAGQMGIWNWDVTTERIHLSNALEKLLGMGPGSFQGTLGAYGALNHPDDLRGVRAKITVALSKRNDIELDARMRHSDGSYRWMRTRGRAIYNNDGRAVRAIGVSWDVTTRKNAELDRQFLLDLSAHLASSTTVEQMVETATSNTGRHLATRCQCVGVDVDSATFTFLHDYNPGGTAGTGTHSLAAFWAAWAELADNHVLIFEDVKTDPRTSALYDCAYLPLKIRSTLAVLLHREGKWRGVFAALDNNVRKWSEREITLLRGVAERLWPAMENARLLREARESRAEFERTFEQAAVGMSYMHMDGRWLRVNKKLCQILGYTREELLSLNINDIIDPDGAPADLYKMEALKLGDAGSSTFERRFRHKSGSIMWLKYTDTYVRDDRSNPRYLFSVIEDITARKDAERMVAESTALAAARLRELEAVYSKAPIGLLLLGKNFRFLRINEQLARNNGVPLADHIGRTIAEVLPQLAPILEPQLRRVMETRQPIVEQELRGTVPGTVGGETIWLVSYFPFEGPDGEVAGLNGVVQDITERKNAEAAWLESAKRLRIATAAANFGILSWEAAEGRMHWENQRMFEIFGRTREQGPLSREEFFESVVHPDDVKVAGRFNDEILSGKRVDSEPLRIRRADGMTRWIQFHAQAELGADGLPIRVVGVTADITEHQKALMTQR